MGYSEIFKGKYVDSTDGAWYIEIVTSNTLGNDDTEIEILSPGVTISYEGSNLVNYSKAMVGSSATLTVMLNEAQRGKLETLLEYPEGEVCLNIIKNPTGHYAYTEWMGHLMVEQVAIQLKQDRNIVDLVFSCGLSSLKYVDFKDPDGNAFSDRQPLIRQLYRCLKHVPSHKMREAKFSEPGTAWTHLLVKEMGLPRPTTSSGATGDWPYDTKSVLANVSCHSRTFSKSKDNSERHRNLYEEPEFQNCYDVVEDICKTFGASIAMTHGMFTIWDKASVFNHNDDLSRIKFFRHNTYYLNGQLQYQDGRPQIITDVSAQTADVEVPHDPESFTMFGATEGRTLPIKGAIFTHEDVESDVIIAEGLARRRFRWMDPTPGFGSHSQFVQNQLSWQLSANDQYSYGSNRDYGYEYIFDFSLYEFDGGAQYYPSIRSTLEADYPTFRVGFPDRATDDIRVEPGQDFTFFVKGDVTLREPYREDSVPFERICTSPGDHHFVKARITVRDTDGTYYRLKRGVTYDQEVANEIDIDIQDSVDFNYSGDLKRFKYEDLNWVEQGEDGYDGAWYTIAVPHGTTADSDNNRENIITQLPSFDGQSTYAGFHLDYDGDDDQVIASEDTLEPGYLKHHFKERIVFQFPETDGVVFDYVKVQWAMQARNFRGVQLWHSGGSDFNPTFPSASVPAVHTYPTRLRLESAQIRLGDSPDDGDLRTVSYGGTGFETLNMGASRLGSRNDLLNPQVTGHLIAPIADDEGVLDFNSNDPALNGYGFVNVRWLPFKNEDISEGDPGVFSSLHNLLCSEAVALYGRQRPTFSGRLNSHKKGGSYFRPYQVLNVHDYDEFTNYKIMFARMEWNMLNGLTFEGIAIDEDRFGAVAGEDIITEETKPRGPSSGRQPGKPSIAEYTSGFTAGTLDTTLGGVIGDLATLDLEVDDISRTYVEWDSVNNVGLADGVFVTHRFTTAEQTKLGNITLTQAIDLDVNKAQTERYAGYDDVAYTKATTQNWNGVVGLGQYAHEMYYVVALDGTGLWERPNITSVAQGYQRQRTIYYNNKAVADNTETWQPLTNLWQAAGLAPNATFADAKQKIQDFLSKQVTSNNNYRWTFLIGNQDELAIDYLLDDYPTGCQAAYSLRQLDSGITYACRVTDAVTQNTLDVGFTADGELDTTSLLTFLGNNPGVVTTMYDQSGNNRHLTQSSVSNAPVLAISGQVYQSNGKPAMNFTGSQFLKTASTYQTNPNGRLYLACVAEWDASNSTANFAFSSWNTTGTSANFQVSSLPHRAVTRGVWLYATQTAASHVWTRREASLMTRRLLRQSLAAGTTSSSVSSTVSPFWTLLHRARLPLRTTCQTALPSVPALVTTA